MSETDYVYLTRSKGERDRTFMHVLYGMHTLAWLSMGSLALIALVINYVKRSEDLDLLYLNHHNYMIHTFWWTVLWLVLSSPLWIFFLFPGMLAYTIIGLWYLYRCLRGWIRFSNDREA